ncbi:MAG: glycosyltransferase family 2 protein [Crocosphaera sp.]|nr:glycosyltransferase family 2 protein [Crocosphaera sp.]
MSNLSTNSQTATSVVVVIVNYKTPQLTIDCLDSLKPEIKALSGSRVIVVDNASGDGSVETIQAAIDKQGWRDWVSLIPSNHNGGYAYGNNLAITPCLKSSNPPNYFLILNPDGLVRPNALKALLDFMDNHPQAGIASGSWEDSQGQVRPMMFRLPNVFNELDRGLRLGIVSKLLSPWQITRPFREQACQVEWTPGCGMLVRRQVFDSVGLMDQEYFLYYEEMDLCKRAKQAGWECWFVPKSRMMVIGGQSTGWTDTQGKPQRRPQYWFDSRRRYFLKNHGWFYAVLVDIAWIFGFSLWRLRRIIQRKPDHDPPQFLADSIRNFFFLLRSGFLAKNP